MRFLALDMGDKAHAAGIMLVGGVVQTLGLVRNHAGFGRMRFAGGGNSLIRASRGRVFDYTCVSLLPQVLRAAPRGGSPRRHQRSLMQQAAKACDRLRRSARRPEAAPLPGVPAKRNGRGLPLLSCRGASEAACAQVKSLLRPSEAPRAQAANGCERSRPPRDSPADATGLPP